eukprot:m.299334 g.299334  ORF g.299334 m.299334 type:complete len:268 (+) comp15869_c1_seq2:3617-4420(+)
MAGKMNQQEQQFVLLPSQELRFETDDNTTVLEIKMGKAEMFGTELIKDRKYRFQNSSVGVFSWHGATVTLKGKDLASAYVSTETPMRQVLNCHAAIERLRQIAQETETDGPRVLVVGPKGSGKSTTSHILANYAVRTYRKPLLVDVDPADNAHGVPGTVGAITVTTPAHPMSKFTSQESTMFHYGHRNAQEQEDLYLAAVKNLAELVTAKLQSVSEARMRMHTLTSILTVKHADTCTGAISSDFWVYYQHTHTTSRYACLHCGGVSM